MNDLAALFAAEPEQPSHDVRYRQGVIVAFDQVTLENTVLVGGATLMDLPLLGVGELTLLVPGAVVGILVVGDAVKSYVIIGRIVTPNTADATDAVSLLNSQIYSDFILAGGSTGSTTYVDLTTIGPLVTVPVGPSGRILILAAAQLQWAGPAQASINQGGNFAVDFTGANVKPPDTTNDPLIGINIPAWVVSAGTISNTALHSVTAVAVHSGLDPGDTTIKMMYRRSTSGASDVDFHRRSLTVFKL